MFNELSTGTTLPFTAPRIIVKMVAVIFVEMLRNVEHSMRRISGSRSVTLHNINITGAKIKGFGVTIYILVTSA
jgi:hypothetical protein